MYVYMHVCDTQTDFFLDNSFTAQLQIISSLFCSDFLSISAYKTRMTLKIQVAVTIVLVYFRNRAKANL